MTLMAAEVPVATVTVSDADVAHFAEHGFLLVERLTTDGEIAELGEVYDRVYAEHTRLPRGVFGVEHRHHDSGHFGAGEVLLPERWFPEIRDTMLWLNSRYVVSRLLSIDVGELHSWGHLIAKGATGSNVTPWHQDEASWNPWFDYATVGTWAPMEDATTENGCQWFIPGSHRGEVLEHRRLGDASAALEVVRPIDCTSAIAGAVPLGGATFHHPRLLHFAGPNRTEQPRRAWAHKFQTAPARRETAAERARLAGGARVAEWEGAELTIAGSAAFRT